MQIALVLIYAVAIAGSTWGLSAQLSDLNVSLARFEEGQTSYSEQLQQIIELAQELNSELAQENNEGMQRNIELADELISMLPE